MSTLSRGCGQRRFSTLLTAQKAIAKGAEGTPVECLGNGAPHWHLAVPAKDTGPDPKTRAAVYARDGSRCVCCGQSIMNRPHSVGHRKRRSQGVDNSLPNLITLLGDGTDPFNPDDHHARIDNHRDPEDVVKGYSLKSWQDPRMVSVMVFASPGGSGGSFYLTDDGHYSTAAPDARGAA